jgi:unsaturated rhamnogalacturonyl hydrolase
LSERQYGNGENGLRPSFLQPWKSENVLVEGITLINTPMWTVHPVYCENVIVRDVHVQSLEAPNGDGVNPDSCRNVLVEYCHFETGDDAIPIKSGLNEDGRRVGKPSENIVARHIDARDVRTGSGGIVIGSETSGGIRNVYVHDCLFVETDRGIRLKSERGRGEVVENLYIQDVEMRDVQNQAININSFYSGGEATGPAPLFRNINIQNVRVDGAAMGVELIGLPEEWVQGFRLKNVTIRADKGVLCRHVNGLTMTEAEIEAGEQVFELDNCTDVTLRWLELSGGDSPVVVQGDETGDVRIDDSVSEDAINVGSEVPGGAVVHVD